MDTATDSSPEQPTIVVTTAAEYEAARAEVVKLSTAEIGPVEQLMLQAFSEAIASYLATVESETPRPDK